VRPVTLDSNIYISALKFGGQPLRILPMATAGEIEIAISEPIIAEVVRVLGDKFEWPLERLAQAERTMRKIGLMVTPTQKLNVVRSDADDNAIVECAVASGSEA
jgi:putative PIN family toxin of toxin-antitoxin system